MIEYMQNTFKELAGSFKATVLDIEAVENGFYKSGEPNSTKQTLNITFGLEDETTGEVVEFVQKYVNPLVGGRGLFQQLLDAIDFVTDVEGGSFNEKLLLNKRFIVTMGKNKKGYAIVATVEPLTDKTKEKPPVQAAKPKEKW